MSHKVTCFFSQKCSYIIDNAFKKRRLSIAITVNILFSNSNS